MSVSLSSKDILSPSNLFFAIQHKAAVSRARLFTRKSKKKHGIDKAFVQISNAGCHNGKKGFVYAVYKESQTFGVEIMSEDGNSNDRLKLNYADVEFTCLFGKVFSVCVGLSDTIEVVKQKIQAQEGIPVNLISLKVLNKPINDHFQLVADLNLQNNSTVVCKINDGIQIVIQLIMDEKSASSEGKTELQLSHRKTKAVMTNNSLNNPINISSIPSSEIKHGSFATDSVGQVVWSNITKRKRKCITQPVKTLQGFPTNYFKMLLFTTKYFEYDDRVFYFKADGTPTGLSNSLKGETKRTTNISAATTSTDAVIDPEYAFKIFTSDMDFGVFVTSPEEREIWMDIINRTVVQFSFRRRYESILRLSSSRARQWKNKDNNVISHKFLSCQNSQGLNNRKAAKRLTELSKWCNVSARQIPLDSPAVISRDWLKQSESVSPDTKVIDLDNSIQSHLNGAISTCDAKILNTIGSPYDLTL